MKHIGKLAAGLTLFSVLLIGSGCAASGEGPGFESIEPAEAETAPVTLATTTTVITTTTEPPVPPDITVNMLAVGDNLVQTYVYLAAQAQSYDGSSYNFTPLYENIRSYVDAADVAIINQETLICGEGWEVSGSNFNFNSPPQLGEDMVNLGFDIFTLANNHMLDKTAAGVHAAKPDGRPSESELIRLAVADENTGAPKSVVLVRIATGRPHQIRIHLASIGHPLAGDPLFLPGGHPAPDSTAVPGDCGYLLHACGWNSGIPKRSASSSWKRLCPPPGRITRS